MSSSSLLTPAERVAIAGALRRRLEVIQRMKRVAHQDPDIRAQLKALDEAQLSRLVSVLAGRSTRPSK